MKYVLSIAALLAAPLALAQGPSGDDGRSDLRVLLVGHDPANPKITIPSLATERTHELYRERTAAFRALLDAHFEHVTVVHGDDYLESMSDEVDVTLFDCRPKELPRTAEEAASDGYVRPRYLSRDFSRPALMIAENSSRLGEPIGLKLDWL